MKFPFILAISAYVLVLPSFAIAQEDQESLGRVDEKPNLFERNRAKKWQQRGQYFYYDNPSQCYNSNPRDPYYYWQRPNPNSYDYDYPPE